MAEWCEGTGLETLSDHQLDLFQCTNSLWFNSLAALVNSELVCLSLPAEILNIS